MSAADRFRRPPNSSASNHCHGDRVSTGWNGIFPQNCLIAQTGYHADRQRASASDARAMESTIVANRRPVAVRRAHLDLTRSGSARRTAWQHFCLRLVKFTERIS